MIFSPLRTDYRRLEQRSWLPAAGRRVPALIALIVASSCSLGANPGSLVGVGAVSLLQPAFANDTNRALIPTAVQFPVIFRTVIDSSRAVEGDAVEAELKEDLVIDDELIAAAGSVVLGHIEKLQHSRRLGTSVVSGNHRFHKGSSMKITFDEIINDEDQHIKIVGCLSKQSVNFIAAKQPRQVEIGPNGELQRAEAVFTTEQKVASQVVNFAASSGLNELGTVASFGAMPVVMGVIGAVEPAMVMNRPMDADEKHPRVKGFAYGVFTSLPGAPVIAAVSFKGAEIRIEPGDELLAQAHSPYEAPAPVLTISSKILKKDAVGVKPAAPSASQNRATATAAAVSKDPSL